MPTRSPLRRVGRRKETAEQRVRREWKDALAQAMADWIDPETVEHGMSRKRLVAELQALGVDVTLQAVGYWLRGEWSPSPRHQAAIAHIFDVPVNLMFPPLPFEVAS